MKTQKKEETQTLGRKPFYSDGLRFECQGSGKCCTSRGAYGFVYLTKEDRKRFAKFFGLTNPEFMKQYCLQKNGHVYLKDPVAESTEPRFVKDCIFLKDNRCSVYEARPEQCRTWPFWPENMNSRAWKTDIAKNCPGVGKGKHYSYGEIKNILATQLEED